MPGDSKQRMVAGAAELLAERGLQGTSFADVIERTGAPRGSIYHHFPGGKEQLAGDAVDFAGALLPSAMEGARGEPADVVVDRLLAVWRSVLTRGDLQRGCTLVAVTVAADGDLLDRAAAAFRSWESALAELLAAGGIPPAQAPAHATLLVAATEGAVLLSRAERSLEPLERVGEGLMAHTRALLS